MIKYLAIVLLFLLASCCNPNVDSQFVVSKKEQEAGGYRQEFPPTNAYMGRFKYHIDITKSDYSLTIYSDSDWEVGKALHLVPKVYKF